MTRAVVLMGAILLLGACVKPQLPPPDEGLIRIEHPRYQFAAAQVQANSICRDRGAKQARHLMTEPPEMSVVVISTSVSTFECE